MSRMVSTHQGKGGIDEYIHIEVLDEPGQGGACHEYRIAGAGPTADAGICFVIRFQNGPLRTVGLNGVTMEALIAVVIDRLKGFQSGSFACESNAEAMEHLRMALSALQHRTDDRIERGVEGTLQP
jgi:hypothetical protein